MNFPNFLKFPDDFSFGSSVSAFQVEGNSGERKSDWDDFLERHSNIISQNEKGPQWWEKGKAEADIDKLADLGVKVQRLSFEWARIEPEKGKINEDAIQRYKEIIEHLHKKKIKPVVTLNHYVLPSWVAKRGAWENRKNIGAFERYVIMIVSRFPEVKTWLTLNEPSVLIESGYLLPFFPPQRGSVFAAFRAHHNMMEAHKKAYLAIKGIIPDSLISMAFSFRWYRPENPKDIFEKGYADLVNYFDSINYVDGVKDYLDFIGVNFYAGYYLNLNFSKIKFRLHGPESKPVKTILFGEVRKPGAYVSDLGAPIVPGFFLDLLQTLHIKFKKPIIITENGIADSRDIHRPFYMLVHLVSLWKAIQQGIDIREYIAWSSVDNLEWLEGYSQEFGLIHIDAKSGKREIRKSAYMYKEIIQEGGIHIEKLLQKYFDEETREKAGELIHHLLLKHGKNYDKNNFSIDEIDIPFEKK
ncbi:MAG TPA: family 1 glycosylhydrolase [Patescibacteria group bacterium]